MSSPSENITLPQLHELLNQHFSRFQESLDGMNESMNGFKSEMKERQQAFQDAMENSIEDKFAIMTAKIERESKKTKAIFDKHGVELIKLQDGFKHVSLTVDGLKADVKGLYTSVEGPKGLKADVKGLYTSVEGPKGLKADVKGLKDDVKGLKDDVKGLKDDVKGLKDDVKGLYTSVEGLDTSVEGLDTSVEGPKGLKTNVKGLETNVKGLEADVEGLKGDSRKRGTETRVLTSRANDINKDFGKWVKEQDGKDDSYNKRIGNHTTQLKSIKDAQLASKTEISEMKLTQAEFSQMKLTQADILRQLEIVQEAINQKPQANQPGNAINEGLALQHRPAVNV